MHLSSLFNMTAGTSTGSILAAGLTIPKADNGSEPAMFADDLIDIYSTQGKMIFKKQELDIEVSVASWIIIFLISTALFFTLGIYKYDNPRVYKKIDRLLLEIK